MKNYIDLHMHSKYSDDGQFEPEHLVEMCKEKGIKIMALADHDSVKGVADVLKAAKENDITCIPAIEIDCVFNGVNLHVLGYGIDHTHDDFRLLEKNIFDQEIANSLRKIELMKELGFEVKKEDLDKLTRSGIYGGEMFAEIIMNNKEYDDHPLLKPYRKGGPKSDNPYVSFYWDYFAQGKPCYIDIKLPSLKETIELIHKHHGIAVLAHPGILLEGQFELFDEIIKEGINGVEVFSNYHDQSTIDYFFNKAKQENLVITCGSDFHGKTKPAIELGKCQCDIDQEFIEETLKQFKLI